MTLRVSPMVQASELRGRSVFLSASIPDRKRWPGSFDAFEITDAVVAAGRAVLTVGGTLVTAAHPTIAPLLLYVAAEFPPVDEPQVVVYQSRLFENVLPDATRRFEELGVGRLVWTEAAEGEEPHPDNWAESLAVMRRSMLAASSPSAAVFIGGMTGIQDEFSLFTEMFPDRPVYCLGRPGGEARRLAEVSTMSLAAELLAGDVYAALFRRVIDDLVANLPYDV